MKLNALLEKYVGLRNRQIALIAEARAIIDKAGALNDKADELLEKLEATRPECQTFFDAAENAEITLLSAEDIEYNLDEPRPKLPATTVVKLLRTAGIPAPNVYDRLQRGAEEYVALYNEQAALMAEAKRLLDQAEAVYVHEHTKVIEQIGEHLENIDVDAYADELNLNVLNEDELGELPTAEAVDVRDAAQQILDAIEADLENSPEEEL